MTQVPKVSKPGTPLTGYSEGSSYKLYLLDVDLLGAALHLDARVLAEGDRHFTEHKGAYAKKFVCQHLAALNDAGIYYWSADGKHEKGEVDFIINSRGGALPIEVKARENVGVRSIARFCERYGIEHAIASRFLDTRSKAGLPTSLCTPLRASLDR